MKNLPKTSNWKGLEEIGFPAPFDCWSLIFIWKKPLTVGVNETLYSPLSKSITSPKIVLNLMKLLENKSMNQ